VKLPELAVFLKNEWIIGSLIPKISDCMVKELGAVLLGDIPSIYIY
jgi:hypothetical protein